MSTLVAGRGSGIIQSGWSRFATRPGPLFPTLRNENCHCLHRGRGMTDSCSQSAAPGSAAWRPVPGRGSPPG